MANRQSSTTLPQSIPLPPKVRALLEGYVRQQSRIATVVQATVDAAAAALDVPDGYGLDLNNLDAGFTPARRGQPVAAEMFDAEIEGEEVVGDGGAE